MLCVSFEILIFLLQLWLKYYNNIAQQKKIEFLNNMNLNFYVFDV